MWARPALNWHVTQHNSRALTLVTGKQVVITAWQPELPSFADLEQRRSALWQRPAWARGVLVDDSASADGPPLHAKLQHVSCPAVPPSSQMV